MVGVFEFAKVSHVERAGGWAATGVRVGVDYGAVRLGFAKSDPTGLLASPYRVLPALAPDNWSEVLKLLAALDPVVLYVGEPVSLRGEKTTTTKDATAWARELNQLAGGLEVRMLDERLTSAMAETQMRSAGVKPSKSKASVDSNAAAILLQSALDYERRHQRWAGHLVAE